MLRIRRNPSRDFLLAGGQCCLLTLVLKMEAGSSSETFLPTCKSKRRRHPKDHHGKIKKRLCWTVKPVLNRSIFSVYSWPALLILYEMIRFDTMSVCWPSFFRLFNQQTDFLCEISSSHGGEYDVQNCLLGCTASIIRDGRQSFYTAVNITQKTTLNRFFCELNNLSCYWLKPHFFTLYFPATDNANIATVRTSVVGATQALFSIRSWNIVWYYEIMSFPVKIIFVDFFNINIAATGNFVKYQY
jgi:hypothetical protein